MRFEPEGSIPGDALIEFISRVAASRTKRGEKIERVLLSPKEFWSFMMVQAVRVSDEEFEAPDHFDLLTVAGVVRIESERKFWGPYR